MLSFWCSLKDDYRTLAELEDVSAVSLYSDTDKEEDNG
jgi:hypothetical protein